MAAERPIGTALDGGHAKLPVFVLGYIGLTMANSKILIND
jgi:hypothetical protein